MRERKIEGVGDGERERRREMVGVGMEREEGRGGWRGRRIEGDGEREEGVGMEGSYCWKWMLNPQSLGHEPKVFIIWPCLLELPVVLYFLPCCMHVCVCVCVCSLCSVFARTHKHWLVVGFTSKDQTVYCRPAENPWRWAFQLKTPEGGLFIRGFNVFQKVSCLMKAAFSSGVTVCLRKCFLSHESGFSSGFQWVWKGVSCLMKVRFDRGFNVFEKVFLLVALSITSQAHLTATFGSLSHCISAPCTWASIT